MAGEGDLDERSDTQEAIMEATYSALQNCGYADLTIQAIADEFAKSKSLLYYHYDTKDDLLVDVLMDSLDRLSVEETVDSSKPPRAQLETFLDNMLPATLDEEDRAFRVTIVELRAQAPMDEAYREQFARADRLVRNTLTEILDGGIETGDFRDIDVPYTVDLLLSLVEGAITRHLVTSEEATVDARDTVDRYLEANVYAE